MLNPLAIAGFVDDIVEPGIQPESATETPPTTVILADGTRAFLRAGDDQNLGTLRTLWDLDYAVYAELSPDRFIVDVHVPLVGRVLDIENGRGGDFDVLFDSSCTRYTVRTALRGASLRDQLRAAVDQSRTNGLPLIVVTELDGHEILDLDPAPTLVITALRDIADQPEVIDTTSILRAADADDLFQRMRDENCTRPQLRPGRGEGCITHDFPDAGCFARAHRMCQLMMEAEPPLRVGKIWVYGGPSVRTRRHPECEFAWFWHVAPFLRIEGNPPQVCVIDPLACRGPATQSEWERELGLQTPPVRFTDDTVFVQPLRGKGRGQNRPDKHGNDETEQWLILMREQLLKRIREVGPPPYQCPPAA